MRQVRGQLYDAQGQPLIGATVSVPGGRNTVTDINGFYMIDVPTNARNISYQSMGMVAENIAVSQQRDERRHWPPPWRDARRSVRGLLLRWHC